MTGQDPVTCTGQDREYEKPFVNENNPLFTTKDCFRDSQKSPLVRRISCTRACARAACPLPSSENPSWHRVSLSKVMSDDRRNPVCEFDRAWERSQQLPPQRPMLKAHASFESGHNLSQGLQAAGNQADNTDNAIVSLILQLLGTLSASRELRNLYCHGTHIGVLMPISKAR